MWIVCISVDCEPGYIVGIYTTEEKADASVSRHKGQGDTVWSLRIEPDTEEMINV